MKYDPRKHHRRSVRLKGYDYSQEGAYFVTICVHHGECRLGSIEDSVFFPTAAGAMVDACWNALPERFPNIELDVFCVMPNHLHAILLILEKGFRRENKYIVLGDMIGAFKSVTTNEYIAGVKERNWEPFDKRFWQRSFFDHIIRSESALQAIRKYIIENPARWEVDKLHPGAPSNRFNRTWRQNRANE